MSEDFKGTSDVCLIIPTYNRHDELARCLHSVERMSVRPCEVIVVDDGSDERLDLAIRAAFPRVRTIRLGENRGPGAARNAGAAEARSEILWFLDSDTIIPDAECLARIVALFREDPSLGIVGGERMGSGDAQGLRLRRIFENGESGWDFCAERTRPVACDYVATCNCAVRRSLFLDVGGFDTALRVGEDKLFSVRVRGLGYRVSSDWLASVRHEFSADARPRSLWRVMYQHHVNRLAFARRALGRPRRAVLPLIDAYVLWKKIRIHRSRAVPDENVFRSGDGGGGTRANSARSRFLLGTSYGATLALAYLGGALRFALPADLGESAGGGRDGPSPGSSAGPPEPHPRAVVMVSERFPPICGGSENQLTLISRRLLERGVTVQVLTRRFYPDLDRRGTYEGMSVRRLGPPIAGPLGRLLFGCSVLVWLIARGRRFDAIHTHGSELGAVICGLAGIVTRRRVIAKINLAGELAKHAGRPWAGLMRMILRRVDFLVAISAELAEEIRRFGIEDSRILNLPNGVDLQRYARPASAPGGGRESSRLGLGVEGRLVCTFTGRLVHRKGLAFLFRAWALACRRDERLILLMVGSGEHQDDSCEDVLREMARRDGLEGSVRFLGWRADVAEVLRASDLFVFPSEREGQPNSVLEALASGLPVIACRRPWTEDLLRAGVDSLLVEPEDVEGFAGAIAALASDDARRALMSEAARSHAMERYDIGSIVAAYERAYTEGRGSDRRASSSRATSSRPIARRE